MKFIELKTNLNNDIKNGYIISGNDRFVCYNALQLFQKKFATNMPEMNVAFFSDNKKNASEIVESCYVLPFCDDYRLVIIKDFKPQNAKDDAKIFKEYFEKPSDSTIVVFFNSVQNVFFKSLIPCLESVNCDKLEEKWLRLWIKQSVGQNGVLISDDAITKLILLSDQNLAKISSEIQKLAGFVGNNGTISKSIVEDLVDAEKEYQIYEFGNSLSKKENKKAFEILNNLLEKEKNPTGLITLLYGHFRRLFNIALSDKNDQDISNYLGVKPIAVKMMRQQVRNFTPKSLKRIVSLLADLELNIKSGKITGDTAIIYAVCSILLVG